MPELPEVESVKRSLTDKLINRKFLTVDIHDDRIIKYNDALNFIDRLEGQTILNIRRRGKFLILELTNDENFIVHLGMVGALLHTTDPTYSQYPDTIKNHILMECFLDDNTLLIYSDYRRFGSLRVTTTDDLHNSKETHLKTLQQMGPEPFDPDALTLFIRNIRQARYDYKPIKDVLLDQRVIAGAGNIYANECLFLTGINPFTTVNQLAYQQLEEIFHALVDLLKLSIEMGGSSIRDYVDGDGKAGTFQTVLKVYDQYECQTCHNHITKAFINNRSTYYCVTCQGSAIGVL